MSTSTSWTVAANVMGTLGVVCWSVQLIPQIWQNYRRKHTHGLQPTMMLLWASAGIPLGVYNILRSFPVALQVQPQILTMLSLITWAQTQFYPPGRDVRSRSPVWCVIILATISAVSAAVETGIVYAIRVGTGSKTDDEIEHYWPVMLMGVLAAVLLAAGVGRHYLDIWKERTVRGISFLFVAIDAMGDLTSLISVVLWWKAGRSLDILGLVVYGTELILWIGVMACGLWYNFRPWMRSRRKDRSQDASSAAVDHPVDLSQNGRRHSTASTVVSVATQASGTVFRTASGHTIVRYRT